MSKAKNDNVHDSRLRRHIISTPSPIPCYTFSLSFPLSPTCVFSSSSPIIMLPVHCCYHIVFPDPISPHRGLFVLRVLPVLVFHPTRLWSRIFSFLSMRAFAVFSRDGCSGEESLGTRGRRRKVAHGRPRRSVEEGKHGWITSRSKRRKSKGKRTE